MPNLSSDPNREPGNGLPVDLYRILLPMLQTQDQLSGAQGYTGHWDDATPWDSGDIEDVWDAIGVSPIIQELFFVLETLEGEDVQVLESTKDLVNPLRCPASLLPSIAASFGYKLAENVSEADQRLALIGLINAFKSRGRRVSFDVFYRLIGLRILTVTALWKKNINEAAGDYSPVRWETQPRSDVLGPSGNFVYTGRLADIPIRPESFIVTDTSVTLRDDGKGNLIGPNGEHGTIDYATGDYTITFIVAAVGSVAATFQQITDEWPYHAARIDVELSLTPAGGPLPLVDGEYIDTLLNRMEEVRPIHVLLRTFALVIDIQDTFAPGATDVEVCVTEARDDRDGMPPSVPGLRSRYLADLGTEGEDTLTIEKIVTGTTTYQEVIFDERGAVICPLDMLIIEGPPGGPFYV